jgi:hypothetical protein
LCLPTAPGLPLWRNGDFGTSPLLLGSSRTSRCLPVSIDVGCRNALHNGGSRNYVLIRFDDGVVRQCGEFELRQTKLRSRKTADEQFYTDGIRPTDLPTPTKPERQSGSQLMCRTLFVPGSVLNRLTAAAQFSESSLRILLSFLLWLARARRLASRDLDEIVRAKRPHPAWLPQA